MRFTLSLIALAACADPTTGTREVALEDHLAIEVATDDDLAGTYTSPAGTVKLFAHAEPEKVTATAFVDDVQIDLHATTGEAEAHVGFRVYGGELDEHAHELLAGVHAALAARFPYPEGRRGQ